MRQLLVGVTLACTLFACSTRDRANEASTTRTAAEGAAPSIYPLRVALEDQRAQAIGLDVHRGHPTIVSMFYGSCPVACPLIISRIKEIESQLPEPARRDVRVLLVSFDGERDTPGALAGIMKLRGLDSARWTLARGSDDAARQIAAVLGISYRAAPGGAIDHDSVLTVLDREGRPLARTDDPYSDLQPLRTSIIASSPH